MHAPCGRVCVAYRSALCHARPRFHRCRGAPYNIGAAAAWPLNTLINFLYRHADFDLRTGQFWAGVFLILALASTLPSALLNTLSGTCQARCGTPLHPSPWPGHELRGNSRACAFTASAQPPSRGARSRSAARAEQLTRLLGGGSPCRVRHAARYREQCDVRPFSCTLLRVSACLDEFLHLLAQRCESYR